MNKITQKVNLVPSLPLDFFGDKTLVPKKSSEEEEDSKALLNFLSTIDDPTVNDAKEEEEDEEDEDEEVRRSEQDNAETSLYRARYEALKTIREGRGSKRKLDNDIIEDKDKEELNSLFANIESIKSISKVINVVLQDSEPEDYKNFFEMLRSLAINKLQRGQTKKSNNAKTRI